MIWIVFLISIIICSSFVEYLKTNNSKKFSKHFLKKINTLLKVEQKAGKLFINQRLWNN